MRTYELFDFAKFEFNLKSFLEMFLPLLMSFFAFLKHSIPQSIWSIQLHRHAIFKEYNVLQSCMIKLWHCVRSSNFHRKKSASKSCKMVYDVVFFFVDVDERRDWVFVIFLPKLNINCWFSQALCIDALNSQSCPQLSQFLWLNIEKVTTDKCIYFKLNDFWFN